MGPKYYFDPFLVILIILHVNIFLTLNHDQRLKMPRSLSIHSVKRTPHIAFLANRSRREAMVERTKILGQMSSRYVWSSNLIIVISTVELQWLEGVVGWCEGAV